MKKENKIQLNQIARRVFLVGLAVVAAFLLSTSERHQKNQLTQELIVDIKDHDKHSFIQAEDIENQLNRSFSPEICERKIGQQEIAAMEALIERDPFVKSAEVFTDAKDAVHVELNQREPVVRILDEFGESYYLDVHGATIPLSPRYTARTLLCTGFVKRFLDDDKNREKLLVMLDHLRNDEFLNALVEQLKISASQQIALVPKMGCDYIEIGELENLEPKLERLKIFYKEAIGTCGWNTYKSLSVKYNNQIVGTRK